MNNELFSWLLVAEIALPLLILCFVLTWMLMSNYKKNKEAARNLILKIKNNEESEKEALKAFLSNKLALEPEKVKKVSKKIINERKFLFRNLISGLLDKNVEAIASLESDMSRITKQYHALEVATKVEEPVDDGEEIDSEKIDELKQEIKGLKHEIHITLSTLNNIFAEFSSMFGEEVPETEMSVDQIITAMESFSGKSVEGGDGDNGSEDPVDGFDGMLDDELDDEPDAFAEVESSLGDIANENEESLSEESLVEDSLADESVVDSFEPDEGPAAEELTADAVSSEADTDIHVDESAGDSENEAEKESLDFSLDDELDDIDSALDELELGSSGDTEPSWDEAFEESGDKPSEN